MLSCMCVELCGGCVFGARVRVCEDEQAGAVSGRVGSGGGGERGGG